MGDVVKLNSTLETQNVLKKLKRQDNKESRTYVLSSNVHYSEFRVSKSNKTINYIDPPGGPRITLGKSIKGATQLGVVKYIDYIRGYGYVITFADDISSNNTN